MMTKEKISEYFIELLNVLEIKTLPVYRNRIFYVYKNKLYIEYNQKTNWAFLNFDKIWSILKTNYSPDLMEIRKLTSNLLDEHLKLKGVTTSDSLYLGFNITERELKLIK